MPAQLVSLANGAFLPGPHRAWANAARLASNASPAAGSVAHFAGDQSIYDEGDDAEAFFKVTEGVVRTCKFLSAGRRQIEAFHAAGEMFGLEAGPDHRLSAEAVNDCTLVSYRRRGVDRLALTDAALSHRLLSFAMQGLSRSQDHALLLGRKSALEKVAAFLLEWSQHSPGGQTVTLAMTRQDIADYLGLTIETVSRTLSHMERTALIELSTARDIRLIDKAALSRLSA